MSKILVVDDDQGITRLLEHMLTRQGHQVLTASNGMAGLQMASQETPDLIVLDIVMPGMGGYDVMRALKSKPSTADIPVIVLTGIEIDGGRVKAVSLGATEYLVKSKGLGKLFEEIDKILNPHLEG